MSGRDSFVHKKDNRRIQYRIERNRLKKITLAALVIGVVVIVVLALFAWDAFSQDEVSYSPVINPEDFVSVINNSYFPLTPGTVLIYEGVSDEGEETDVVTVTNDTKAIMGVVCVVVQDRVTLNGELAEETFDWYAQDKEGNVWYFGEDSKEYSGGAVVSTEGSWEAGVDGAKPGIVMKAHPAVGDSYRQEYYKGEAEDWAEVLSLSESASVPFGSFTGCLKTKDWTPLEPDVTEQKYYAPGVGCILEVMVEGGSDRMELVSVTSG